MSETLDIKRLRELLGATQAQFGNLVHTHWVTVSRWERKHSEPDAWQYLLMDAIWTNIHNDEKVPARAAKHIKKNEPMAALAVLLAPTKEIK